MTANAGISSKGFSASVDDTFLKTKILTKISTEDLSNLTDIAVSVSLGEVLLTGYSSDQINRLKLVENVMKTEGVKKVYNEVQINPTVSLTVERFFSEMDDIRKLITIINIKKRDEKI